MITKMKNYEIIDKAEKLNTAFSGKNNTQLLPMTLSFYIQRNKKRLNDIAENINTCKNQIIQRFGTPSEEDKNVYVFQGESEEKANKEFSSLMNIEIDVEVDMVNFKNIGSDVQISNEQMEAILFMIEE